MPAAFGARGASLLPPSHRRGQPANTQAPPAPNAAGIRTQLSSYQTAPTEYSGQRYRRGRRLTVFRPPVAQDHAHFCHEYAAAQQPGQDPRNTHKVPHIFILQNLILRTIMRYWFYHSIWLGFSFRIDRICQFRRLAVPPLTLTMSTRKPMFA